MSGGTPRQRWWLCSGCGNAWDEEDYAAAEIAEFGRHVADDEGQGYCDGTPILVQAVAPKETE